jgi:hypothetical protein
MLRKVVIVMSVFLKILLVVVIIFVLAVAGGIFYLTRGLGEGAKLVINSVDPAGLPDGEYNGSYKGGRWTNEMKVTVRDQKITQIEVVKDVAIAKPEVTQDVITKSSINRTWILMRSQVRQSQQSISEVDRKCVEQS